MNTYNWQQPDWPRFRYDLSGMEESLFLIAEKMGFLNGKVTHLDQSAQTEAIIDLMVEEAVKTSEIEGAYIQRPDIQSSIKNKLGLNPKTVPIHDKRAQGIAELMLDVRDTFKQPLTKKKLFEWHSMLMSGFSNRNLKVGGWRVGEEPMQIISRHYGKWIVHYEAPPSKIVSKEMQAFIDWFNETAPGKPKAINFAPVRAAIAHLYFESIHPFEDGNGRIGRAIAEKALSQGFGYAVMISLSLAIELEEKAYYAALNAASKTNEITHWIHYFVKVILSAQIEAEKHITFIFKKSKFFDEYQHVLNARQLKVVKRMMREGVKGFEGGMTAKKYMIIANTSKATATRDLQHLLKLNVLKQIGSGRNVHYELVL